MNNCIFCNDEIGLCQVCGRNCEAPICYSDLQNFWKFTKEHKIKTKLDRKISS